jgi:hypothetical protein
MNRVLLASVLCLGVGTLPCRADWVAQQPAPAAASPAPVTTFSAPAPAFSEGGCGCGSPCESSCCGRPGLIARIRERLHSHRSESCCNPRPGLFERIRMRRAERHGCCP